MENAIYGGEMSSHHYFRSFAYCDSGMIPWLLVAELVNRQGKMLSQLIGERIARFPCSGEVNSTVGCASTVMQAVQDGYQGDATEADTLDGLSPVLPEWRVNISSSNTEPLLRVNIESRANPQLVADKMEEIRRIISSTETQD
ncbi:phosphomannomutase/phosphoglucomutase [compost metagenome]